ncbi:hypothetical protein [Methanotorris formicicus]|uniref:Condensin complex subunit 1 C-terminal domain-containing protein n=1 Tax=Methanotorris formicicus Mc-S-70 TaxID=647171 RepID=H1L054_9EURY|nr:hypothetical protein [Methanotorris formicicus]EHP85188.1 hypothetical protein MetfoDRAFT_1428 [Methanotorris formicicus Mc-S-70]
MEITPKNAKGLISSKNYTDRLKLIDLISEIKDEKEFKKMICYLAELLYDDNMLVKIKTMNLIKNILSENLGIIHSPEFKKLVAHVYVLTFVQNKMVQNTLKSLIETIPEYMVEEIIVELSYQLYSKNGLRKILALIKLFAISWHHPKYLKDKLPHLLHLLTNNKLRIIQMFIILIIEKFRDDDKTTTVLHKVLKYIPINIDGFRTEEDVHQIVKIYFDFEHIGREEIEESLKYLDDGDIVLEILSLGVIERNVGMLFEIFDKKKFDEFINKILDMLCSRYAVIQILSYLILSKIITYDNIDTYLDKDLKNKYLSIIFDMGEKFLIEGNSLVKGYTLESLTIVYANYNDPKVLERIKDIVDKYDVVKFASEHQILYNKIIQLLLTMGRNVEDYLTPNIHPNFNERYVEELKTAFPSKIFEDMELKLNSRDWFNRYIAGKVLGNILYTYPYHISEYYRIAEYRFFLSDNVWVIRSVGAWILRVVCYKGFNLPKDDCLNIFEGIYDWCPEVVVEYLILYAEVIKYNPKIVDDEDLKKYLLSSITMAYLVSSNTVIKLLAKYLLKNFPEMDYVVEYFEKDDVGRLGILEKLMEKPEFIDVVFTKIKVWLNREIKKNNEETIKRILEFVKGKYFISTSFLLYELILLYDKYDLAKEILDTIKSKYPESIEYFFMRICEWVGRYLVPIKREIVKELLTINKFGIRLNENVLETLKELVIYEDDKELLKYIDELFDSVGEEEGLLILKEKNEIKKEKRFLIEELNRIIDSQDLEEFKRFIKSPWRGKKLIPKIVIIDHIIESIVDRDVKLLEFFNRYSDEIFKYLCLLVNETPCKIFKKYMEMLIVAYIVSNPGMFGKLLVNHPDLQIKCADFIDSIFKKPYSGIKLELLDMFINALDEDKCDKITQYLPELSKLLNHRMWDVKSRALKVITSMDIAENEVDDVVMNILKNYKYSDEDFRLRLLRALRDLPISKKHFDEVIKMLEGIETSDEYTRDIIKNILDKYKNAKSDDGENSGES